jgi:hypothetical protein
MCTAPVELKRALRVSGSDLVVLVPPEQPPITAEVGQALRRIVLAPEAGRGDAA